MCGSPTFYSEFEEAYLRVLEKHPHLDRRSAITFVRTLVKRNQISRQRGERDYFQTNLRLVLAEYKLRGEDARAYKSLAGFFFGRRGLATRKKNTANKRNRSRAQILIEVGSGQYAWSFNDR